MSQPALLEIQISHPFPEAVRLLSKYGFYFSLFVYIYAVLFPFHFDFSSQHLLKAWSQAICVPFWDAKRGAHISGDDIANILIAIPFGFFGFLYFPGRTGKRSIFGWCFWGLALGLAAEFTQLSIPTRASVITDAINNGLGALLGSFFAFAKGRKILEFVTGAAAERRNIYLWLLIWSLVAMVGPYDVRPDFFSDLGSDPTNHVSHLQESGMLTSGAWLQIAGFALIGGLAARLAVPGRRRRTLGQPLACAGLVLLFPVVLQFARLLVESRSPALDDMALDLFGALAGAFTSLFIPPAFQAFGGLLLFTAALIVSGLSPFSFSTWQQRGAFQWIPFFEFCSSRSPVVFYETVLCYFSFAVVGGLFQLSFPQIRRRYVAVYALVFAAAIEFSQTFLPARATGITNIIMSALGSWTGAHICAAVESARLIQRPLDDKGR